MKVNINIQTATGAYKRQLKKEKIGKEAHFETIKELGGAAQKTWPRASKILNPALPIYNTLC